MFRSIVLFLNMVLMDTPITSLLNSCLLPICFCFRSLFSHSAHKTRWKQSLFTQTSIRQILRRFDMSTSSICLVAQERFPWQKYSFSHLPKVSTLRNRNNVKLLHFTMFNIQFSRHLPFLCAVSHNVGTVWHIIQEAADFSTFFMYEQWTYCHCLLCV